MPTATKTATRRHIRGASLLLLGRLITLGTNVLIQVAIVRYLSKSDYGAFAYALSIASMGSSAALLGLNRALNRFVPIHHEERDYPSMFGTIALALGSATGLGLALVVLVFGLQGFLASTVVSDPLSLGLLLILIGLAPLTALDSLFQGLVAIFAGARAVFFRRHVLGPCLRLAAVAVAILSRGSVRLLALCYLAAGVAGVWIYAVMTLRVLAREGLLRQLDLRAIRLPFRRIFGFAFPLLTTDVFFILKTTMAVMLLEHFRGTTTVAEFRAVVPIAGLNLIVLQSLKLLYTPTASRLHARRDTAGMNDLFGQSAVWISVLTFPVFGASLLLAKPLTVLLFGGLYAGAGAILAVLAAGNYFNAAMGLNTYTLQVHAKVRFLASVNAIAALIGLGLNLWLIPRHGAVGAAVATAAAVVVLNLLTHAGLLRHTPVDLFERRYLRVYASILALTLALVAASVALAPPVPVRILLVVLASAALLRAHRHSLDIAGTFPELARVPLLRRLLDMGRVP